jgi:ABC-type transport system involved in multi-copper enzyme maturation permease subunit
MLKKEWQDILLPVLLRLLIGPVLAGIYSVFAGTINATSALLFFMSYAVSVLWVAMHMGLNAFHSEFRDHAFEYLFTFPFSRSRLLVSKFTARLLILGFLFIFYFLLQSLLKLLSVLPPSSMLNSPLFNVFDFSFMALSFFVIGFFLSLVDWDSARPAIPLLILVSQFLLALFIQKLLCRLGGSTEPIGGMNNILFMVSTGVFFIFSFRRLERGTLGNGWSKNSKKSLPLVVCQKNGRNWGLLNHELLIIMRSFFFTVLFIPVLGFLSIRVFFIANFGRLLLDPVVSYATSAFFLIMFFAFYSGYGLFYREFHHKALEYLLTFPLSLRRILIEKLLARIFVLLPAVIAYMIIAGRFAERLAMESGFFHIFLRPAFFPVWVALMLLNGFFLSIFEMKNIMALVSLANLYVLVLVPLALFKILKHLSFTLNPQTMALLAVGSGLLLTTAILAGVFFRLLPRFDLAAPNRYSRVFGLFLFTTFTILSLAGLAVVLFV